MKLGYIRVSSILQNTERQLDGMELDKVFTDKLSAKDVNRPQLQELISFAREGDVIYVHSIDRLSRSLKDLKNLIETFKKNKVTIKFLKENLTFNDESNPTNDLLLGILGSIAEFERNLTLERQREGVSIAKQRGKYAGRKKALSKEEQEAIKTMILQHTPKSQIAKHFKISRQTLYNYL